MDTIVAEATAAGRAGVAVIRISGPSAIAALQHLAGRAPEPRRATLMPLRSSDGILDTAVVLVFESGASFTGEAVVELQTHGSVAVVRALITELVSLPDIRLAEAGEFTKRALENDQLDLAQVEGLADLIDAETEAQRRSAQAVFAGALGTKVEGWRSRLVRAAALLEAMIDFADEEVPEDTSAEVLELVDILASEFDAEAQGVKGAERVRQGFEVAIVGAPNTGKSTLLNRLAGRDAAITSEIAGTTRDVIEVRMDVAGLPVTLLDTAGLRETIDHVEAIGVERAKARASAADLRIFLGEIEGLAFQDGDILVRPKSDLGGEASEGLPLSGLTGQGVDDLLARIERELEVRVPALTTATRARHRSTLEDAAAALRASRIEVEAGPGRAELAAEELRTALRRIEALTGRIGVEDLLGEIFSSFCIGK
ncbi:tRNA uridine-5-carboxymethylaminomethyl(34) synthesis GTPase MnmE [Vannielia litorea]|uniref:tRNA uridine-5-carboxymethylaminomethyl(34) synthesis GTPase MnmE n=1 Tax=Vannielia litorea TaxID=1217970 RepID=UPI001C95A702|nr:tRNA uridine-5-carboxymethylaminomethyl(34) synthesis GTPase MnmE [Vannielia litorea]MBY6049303.1 tRNA uridine-5-carboxymethylaminomethyl(34) synthesis GTPase MnmE [Vannielia litorea]MBY6076717.1 tRNA uridine-5-carboxymethylaminomethyl(34) synthesis GTPase MnmE [Vannielia litorea]